MEHQWHYGHYRIVDVFGRTTSEDRRRIIALWRRNGILPAGAAPERRARQVVLMALNTDEEVVGVNTVYRGRLGPGGKDYFFYRMFIQPGDRVPGMMRFLTQQAFEVLRLAPVVNKPAGVVFNTENPKLMRAGMYAMLQRGGWTWLGRDARGQDLWRREFAEGPVPSGAAD